MTSARWWPTTPTLLDADTSYRIYAITPVKAFGLPSDGESFAPTRWTFG